MSVAPSMGASLAFASHIKKHTISLAVFAWCESGLWFTPSPAVYKADAQQCCLLLQSQYSGQVEEEQYFKVILSHVASLRAA